MNQLKQCRLSWGGCLMSLESESSVALLCSVVETQSQTGKFDV